MIVAQDPHEWSKDALLTKAVRYASLMIDLDRNSWQFGFWSALTLELLARASLPSISPVLLADSREWTNVYYALGHSPNVKRFQPKSISITETLDRLEKIYPDFTPEMRNFSVVHMNRRNTELHSGELVFDGLNTSEWLPMFYCTVQIFLKLMNEDLDFLLGASEANTARTLIQALSEETSKEVTEAIKSHRLVWEGKSEVDRDQLVSEARVIASRHAGHRVDCPACKSPALLQGSPTGSPQQTVRENLVIEKRQMLPSSFECTACGLKLIGYSKLKSAGLGAPFVATVNYDPVDYFKISPEDFFEDDYNE